MSDQYTLLTDNHTTTHYPALATFLGDRAAPSDPELDARVRSGDYFITLATTLETIAEELTEVTPVTTGLALTKLARDLDYIQKHYQIDRKPEPDTITELH